MLRGKEIGEISDGKLYTLNDMAKLGSNECRGCSTCCREMVDTIILDPMDIYELGLATGKSFDEMLGREIELNMVDGMILPNLKPDSRRGGCCFLNEEGRCSIHAFRPGFCRLFPLGRYYHDGGFSYILQKDECSVKSRYKIRIRQWVDRPDPETYDQYALDWHMFVLRWTRALAGLDESTQKDAMLYFLKLFYRKPYQKEEDFYSQVYTRIKMAERYLF